MEVRYYRTEAGQRPFEEWRTNQDGIVRAKIAVALKKIENGNLSSAKSVGGGVLEFRIDFGPGYRLYFGRDGDVLVIMLGGGDKRRQQRDINEAIKLWGAYRRDKRRP